MIDGFRLFPSFYSFYLACTSEFKWRAWMNIFGTPAKQNKKSIEVINSNVIVVMWNEYYRLKGRIWAQHLFRANKSTTIHGIIPSMFIFTYWKYKNMLTKFKRQKPLAQRRVSFQRETCLLFVICEIHFSSVFCTQNNKMKIWFKIQFILQKLFEL